MSSTLLPQIIYAEIPEESEAIHLLMTYKGWVQVTIGLPDGSRYRVECIDPVRLTQNMESDGDLFYDEPCLVLLDEVTEKKVENAINALYEQGYFTGLIPQPIPLAPLEGKSSSKQYEGMPTITLPDIARVYMTDKEWVQCEVTLPDGRKHEVELRTPLLLKSNIELVWKRSGRPYYAKTGLIVVKELTDETLEQTISAWYKRGFFDQWVGR